MSKKIGVMIGVTIILGIIAGAVISVAFSDSDIDNESHELVKEIEENEESLKEELSDEEHLIHSALNMLYTVPEADYYVDTYLELLDASIETGQATPGLTKGFSDICSEEGLEQIMSDRIFITYMQAAHNKQFTITIDEIELKEYFKKIGDGSILNPYDRTGYEYEVKLRLEYTNGDIETVYEDGHIHIAVIDGEILVDQLRYRLLNDVFMPVRGK